VTPATVRVAFGLLSSALERYRLPTSSGAYRTAKAHEFMLMQESKGRFDFKHRDSRNYLWMFPDGRIVTPAGGSFHQATYDLNPAPE
jgi:hypothetical protein